MGLPTRLRAKECPICFDALTAEKTNCANGHAICSACIAKMAKHTDELRCPMCRVRMPSSNHPRPRQCNSVEEEEHSDYHQHRYLQAAMAQADARQAAAEQAAERAATRHAAAAQIAAERAARAGQAAAAQAAAEQAAAEQEARAMAEAAELEAEGAHVQSLRIGNHHRIGNHADGRSWEIFVEGLTNCHGIAHVDFYFGAPLHGPRRCRSITGSVVRKTPTRMEPFDIEIEVMLLRGGRRTFTHRLCFDGDGIAGTRVHNVVIRPRRLPADASPLPPVLQEWADRLEGDRRYRSRYRELQAIALEPDPQRRRALETRMRLTFFGQHRSDDRRQSQRAREVAEAAAARAREVTARRPPGRRRGRWRGRRRRRRSCSHRNGRVACMMTGEHASSVPHVAFRFSSDRSARNDARSPAPRLSDSRRRVHATIIVRRLLAHR